MADDVKFTIGGDTKSGEQALDRIEKKLDATGEAAKKAGKKVSDSSKEQGIDLEAVGNKSERAASSLLQLSQAVTQIGKGGADLQTLSVLAKEATGTLGDLGDTLIKLGGGRAAIGGMLQSLSGFLGPAGVLIAGATALWSVWRSFNSEVERTPPLVDGVKKRLDDLRQEASRLRTELAKTLEAKAPDRDTGLFKEMLRDVSTKAPGSGSLSDLVNQLTQQIVREQSRSLTPEERSDPRNLWRVLSPENIQRVSVDVMEMIKEAEQGVARTQEVLRALIERASQETEPEGAGGKALQALTKAREDREKQDAEVERKKQRAKEEEEQKAAQQRAEATAKSVMPIVEAAQAGGKSLEAIMEEITKALRHDGLDQGGIADVIREINRELTKQQSGLAALNRALDEERRIRAEAVARERQAAEEKRRAEEAERQRQVQEDQQVIGQHLAAVVQLLKELNGNSNEANRRLVEAFRAQGADPATAARRADLLVQRARQQAGVEDQQAAVARAVRQATGQESIGDILRRLIAAERSRVGGPLDEKRVAEIREQASAEFERRLNAMREGLAARQRERRDDAARGEGFMGLSDRQRAAMERRERMEQEALEREIATRRRRTQEPQRLGDAPKDIREVGQNVNELGRGHQQMLQEIMATITQLGATVSNMTKVNTQARQVARTVRQQLPGPGTRRNL